MKILVVGIAGGTASGKTTVVHKILERLAGESISLLDEDSYYRDLSDIAFEERKRFNFDHPDAFDHDLMLDHIRRIKRGEPVEKPVYSFIHCIRKEETITVLPAKIIMIEGILVLDHAELRQEMDLKIFVDTDDDVRLARRITRDVRERGRTLDEIVEQYFKTVRPMHLGFVVPSKRNADIIIPHGGNNAAAIDMVVGALRARL